MFSSTLSVSVNVYTPPVDPVGIGYVVLSAVKVYVNVRLTDVGCCAFPIVNTCFTGITTFPAANVGRIQIVDNQTIIHIITIPNLLFRFIFYPPFVRIYYSTLGTVRKGSGSTSGRTVSIHTVFR